MIDDRVMTSLLLMVDRCSSLCLYVLMVCRSMVRMQCFLIVDLLYILYDPISREKILSNGCLICLFVVLISVFECKEDKL